MTIPTPFDVSDYAELLAESREAFLRDSGYGIQIAKAAGKVAERAGRLPERQPQMNATQEARKIIAPTKAQIRAERRERFAQAQATRTTETNALSKWADEQIEDTLHMTLVEAATAIGVSTSTVGAWRQKWLDADPIKPRSKPKKARNV